VDLARKLPPSWEIERISGSDLSNQIRKEVPPAHSVLEAIRQELLPKLAPEEFRDRYSSLLGTDSQKVSQAPEVYSRGAEAYWIRNESTPIAGMILHFYNWQVLAPQICFRAERRDNENAILSLAKFEHLAALAFTPQFAAELSFLWVAAGYRRQGLGRLLFQKSLDIFGKFLKKHDFGFVAARGKLGGEEGQTIFQYLMANEEKKNGRSPDTGQVRIAGLGIPVEELNNALKIDCRYLPIHPDSIATAVLAQRANMRFIGYFRSTNSIFGKSW
jgi:GNAT superfamily N-acetyltransferase